MQLYTAIQKDLISGKFEAGLKLKISELQRRYDTGLSPLREALNRLAAQGSIEQHGQKGFRVPPLCYDDIVDIRDTRIHIECQALKQSILNGDTEWESKLISAKYRLDKIRLSLADIQTWEAAHEEFHLALISACPSQRLNEYAHQLNSHMDRYRRIADPDVGMRDTLDEQHGELLELILKGDIDGAVNTLEKHIKLSSLAAINSLKYLSQSI